jgi:hypothetical protein
LKLIRALALFLMALPSVAYAAFPADLDTLKIQKGRYPDATFTDVSDTFIREAAATTNYGSVDTLVVSGAQGVTATRKVLIRFGLSPVPAGFAVEMAILHFYQKNGSTLTNAPRLHFYVLFNSFVETQATWNIRSTGNNFVTAGCASKSIDSEGSAHYIYSPATANADTEINAAYTGWGLGVATTTKDIPQAPYLREIPKASGGSLNAYRHRGNVAYDITQPVNAWLYGGFPNNGIVIWADEDGYASNGNISYMSSDYPDATYRPWLEIIGRAAAVPETLIVGSAAKGGIQGEPLGAH